jgi:molybdenum cofactor biosynthesis enzyme
MVDVSSKPITKRVVAAEAVIGLRPETIAKIDSNEWQKGTS